MLPRSKVGPIAYKLELPPTSAIHPVFHVSQLKQAVSPSVQVSPSVPDMDNTFQFREQILSKRLVSKGLDSVHQVLVKWPGWPASLATWEDFEALRQRFPAAPAWGQAGSLEPGNVTTSTTARDQTGNDDAGPRRSSRPRKPNARFCGPEWNQPCQETWEGCTLDVAFCI